VRSARRWHCPLEPVGKQDRMEGKQCVRTQTSERCGLSHDTELDADPNHGMLDRARMLQSTRPHPLAGRTTSHKSIQPQPLEKPQPGRRTLPCLLV
jgi:hypothetical protein